MAWVNVFTVVVFYLYLIDSRVLAGCGNSSEVTFTACSTCTGRCGHAAQKNSDYDDDLSNMCSCDANCLAYGDCCYDFSDACPNDYDEGSTIFKLAGLGGSSCRRLRLGTENTTFFANSLMVDRCTDGIPCPWTSDLVDMARSIPLTDLETGIHYLNYACAICNRPKLWDFRLWQPWLDCDDSALSEVEGMNMTVSNETQLQRLLDLGFCKTKFSIAPSLQEANETSEYVRECMVTKSYCDPWCNDTQLVKNCMKGIYQAYVYGSDSETIYRNPYCAYCSDKYGDSPVLFCQRQSTTTLPITTTTTLVPTTTTTVPPLTIKPSLDGQPRREKPSGVQRPPLVARGRSSVVVTGDGSFGLEPGLQGQIPDFQYEIDDGFVTTRDPTTTPIPGNSRRQFRAFSLKVLVDFNPRPISEQKIPVSRNPCGPDEIWIPKETSCKPVLCQVGFVRINASCVPSTMNINFTMTLMFQYVDDANTSLEYIERNEMGILQDFLVILSNIFHNDTQNKNSTSSSVLEKTNITMSNSSSIIMHQDGIKMDSFDISFFIKIIFHLKDKPHNISSFFSKQSKILTESLKNIIVKHIRASGIDVSAMKMLSNGTVVFAGVEKSWIRCKLVAYNESEYIKDDNDTVTILATNRSYAFGTYFSVGQTVRVCINVRRTKMQYITLPSSASGTLGLVTLVLISLSVICLLIRLILQIFIPYYRSLAGWLQFHLCLSLCLAFVSLLMSGTITILAESETLCIVVAVLMYWMFLAAFAWMLTISFNTWIAFRPSSAFKRASKQDRHEVLRYVLFAWLFPLLLTGVVLGLDFSKIDNKFKPFFGVGICWFNQHYPLLFYFGVPIACCMISSIVFYSLTIHSIRKTYASATMKKSSQNPSRIRIYASLFVVMGICWVFGFLASLIPLQPPFESALWYIFIILNASQGILIFIFFVCKGKVLNELRKQVVGKGKKELSSGASTKSRTGSTGV